MSLVSIVQLTFIAGEFQIIPDLSVWLSLLVDLTTDLSPKVLKTESKYFCSLRCGTHTFYATYFGMQMMSDCGIK